MNKQIKFRRSGDVNLHPIENLPTDAVEVECGGEWVMARGEATGSEHKLIADKPDTLKVFKDSQGRFYFKLNGTAQSTHTSDHATTIVLPGIYTQVPEREVDHFADSVVRKVVD
jgi:hypothetical protein